MPNLDDKKQTILVVDDDPEIVDILKNFFALKGYHVIGAFDGKEALGILERERADVMLLDIMMPGMKGSEVAKIVKEKYPRVKLMVITGQPEEGRRLERDAVLDGLFIKPIGINDLYVKLLDVLNESPPPPFIDVNAKKGIRARVLLIRAKLLIVEPSPDAYQQLQHRLQELSARGEHYEIQHACSKDEALQKLKGWRPDIVIVNMRYVRDAGGDLIGEICRSADRPKETIMYNAGGGTHCGDSEAERLVKAIQAFCFKNGLIEIRWVVL